MATHSSTLTWKIPWTEEPGRLQSMGSLRVRHNWTTSLSLFTFMHCRRKWEPTPVFLPGESRDGGAWWAAIYGVAQSRTWLIWLGSSRHAVPDSSVGKESTCNAGDPRLSPGSGRSSGEGKGYPLQYSGLENFMHPWGRKESDTTERPSLHFTMKQNRDPRNKPIHIWLIYDKGPKTIQ